jgi:hypothetical protein
VKTFLHTGHIGDIIAFLPTMRALGGGKLIIKNHDPYWPAMKGFRYESLKPLLECQEYIKEIEYNDNPSGIDYDNTHWRQCKDGYAGFRENTLLSDIQAEYWNVKISYDNWINAKASTETKDRIIITRTGRYCNYNFPWRKILRHIGERALFIGTNEEWNAFQNEMGINVEHYKTENLLNVAEAIKGSDMLVCEQSCPWWIAAAMGHKALRSTSWYGADGTIKRDNLLYSKYGHVEFSIFDK